MTVPRTLRLDEVAEVTAGNPAPQEQTDFCIDGAPFVRMQDVGRTHWTKSLTATTDRLTQEAVARHRLRRFPRGTLLIPKSGASVNLNHRALLGTDAYVVSHLATIIPDATKLDAEYLYYWSLTYDPRHHAQTTSLPSLPTALIKAARLPVPSMPEQRRIVDLLSRAEGIVRLRREAQQKAAELIPAIFIDMFGDPATNPKGWPTVKLGQLLSSIDSGHSPKCGDRHRGVDEWGVLRLGAVSRCEYDEYEHKTLPRAIEPDSSIEVKSGDLLLSRKNTAELVGAAAYVWATDGRILLPDLIFRLQLVEAAPVNAIYLWKLLTTDAKRRALTRLATGSAGSMPNISKERLRTLPVEVPTLGLQTKFADLVKEIRSIRQQQQAAIQKGEEVFASLLAGAFSGM